jgi:predicted ATPase/DNA-binding winged helix-turn-helix (wHTH) protein
MDILSVLLSKVGGVVSKEEIIRQVWPDTVVEENNLRVHLTALRKLLGEGHLSGRYIENIPGRGYSFVATVERQTDSPETLSTAAKTASLNNLPGTTGEILGRDALIAAVAAQLPQRRLITLTGSGGVGKTTVATAVADTLTIAYEDGVAFIDLATISDPSMVNGAVGSVVGCSLGSQEPTQDLVKHIGGRRMLLLLDNCEHVIEGCASVIAALLKGCRGVSILTTSREPLHIPGEWVQQISPLALPPLSAASSLKEAIQYPAIRLFIDRACAALATFSPTDSDAPVIIDICNRLDGVALAIELAAGRVNSMGLRALASSLDASLSALSHGQRTAAPRHQAVRAMIDWSYRLLPEIEKRVFRQLGIFNGPFAIDAVRFVCGVVDAPAAAIDDALMNLIDKSLVVADIGGDFVRYRLLETTRIYARDNLRVSADEATIDRRHAEYHRILFERAEAEWLVRPTTEWRNAYGDQIGNLRSALAWSNSSAGDSAIVVALTVAAIPLWFQLSLVDECLENVLHAMVLLDATSDREARKRMKLYAALGWPQMSQIAGAQGGAAAWKMALDLARSLQDDDFQSRSLWALWVDRVNCARPREALEYAREFHTLALRGDESADQWIGERMLGAAFHFVGDQRAARIHLDRMLKFYVEPQNRSHAVRFQFDQRVTARVALSRVLWLQGFTQKALAEVQDTVTYALAIDHRLSLANVLAEAACPIALLAGEFDLAERYIELLHEQTTTRALDVWHTYAACFRGESLIGRGATAEGLAALQSGLNRLRHGGFLLFESAYLAALARGYLATAHGPDGMACVDRALKNCAASGEGWYVAELLRLRGELLLLEDSTDQGKEAERVFQQSLQTAREQGALAWELRGAMSSAKIYVNQGRAKEAKALLDGVIGGIDPQSGSQDLISALSMLAQL